MGGRNGHAEPPGAAGGDPIPRIRPPSGAHKPGARLRARLVEILGLPAAAAGVEATFGERLRAARLRAGLTQRELAERIGVGQQVVSEWEMGKRVPDGRHTIRLGGIPEQRC